MSFIPSVNASVSYDHDTGRVGEHAESVLHGFIGVAVDNNRFSLDTIAITILAEKHTVSEAWLYPGNVWWNVEYARGNQQSFAGISVLLSKNNERTGFFLAANHHVIYKSRTIP